jgi:beta-glucosidase
MRTNSMLPLLAALAGCGPSPIAYPAMGPLSGAAGKGRFRFGVATAATQIEDQDTNTDWYEFTRPKADGGLGGGKAFVGDAVRGYSLALDDVQLLSALHVDSYRFSIEWARVEPKRGLYDEAALSHYDQLIDALKAAGIRPLVTLHHFSNPRWVVDPHDPDCLMGPSDDNLCGLAHPQGGPLVVEAMADFAAKMAARYGDRVDEWGTQNEPLNYLLAAYGVGQFPPAHSYALSQFPAFLAVLRNFLEAHARMYDAIKAADLIDADGDGAAALVGLSLSVAAFEPAQSNAPSTDPVDVGARDRVAYVYHQLYPDAIMKGALDTDLDGAVDEPHPSWAGKLDWLGVQYYMRMGVTGNPGFFPVVNATPCFPPLDFGACLPPKDPTFCVPMMGYETWPPGLYTVLRAFTARYPTVPLVVTEAGLATADGTRRAENVVRILEQIERARAAGTDVRGYYHWSMMDNFEWAEGFGPRFGLYAVDRSTYARTATLGATVFGEIAAARRLTEALRRRHGGDGPMTPEPGGALRPGDLCAKR